MSDKNDAKRDIRWHEHDDDDTFYGPSSVVSYTDCTGLIPSAPLSDDEEESYIEIYDIPRPRSERYKKWWQQR